MSAGKINLHSHSELERKLNFPKHIVLIDARFKDLFADGGIRIEPFKYDGVEYYKVPILAFARKGGEFKNLDK